MQIKNSACLRGEAGSALRICPCLRVIAQTQIELGAVILGGAIVGHELYRPVQMPFTFQKLIAFG